MKIDYATHIQKTDSSVLVAEAIFSELEISHPIKSISEIANTSSGGTPSRSNTEYYGGNIPWLKSGELNDGIIESAEEFITEKGLANSSAKLHPENTLLLAMYGATAGRTGITKFNASTNQAVCALFPKSVIDQGFLFWFLRQHRYKFIEISKGGAQPNISQSVINSTKIPLPSMELQVEISYLLFKLEKNKQLDLSLIPAQFKEKVERVFKSKNSVFEIDAELNNQLSYLKQLRQSFLREGMQGKLVASSSLERTGDEAETGQRLLEKIKAKKAQLIKDKKLKKGKELPQIAPEEIPFEIPDNWIWCRLCDIVKITGGGTPSMANSDYWHGDIPWISPKDMSGEIISDSKMKITKKGVAESSTSLLPAGSLLIVGRSGILKRKLPIAINTCECTVNQDMKVLIPHLVGMNRYLQLMLFGLEDVVLMNYVKFGMTVHSLKYQEFEQMPIPLPPFAEQNRIVTKLEQLMKTCDQLEASIKQSQLQNKQLLQQVLKEALEVKNLVA